VVLLPELEVTWHTTGDAAAKARKTLERVEHTNEGGTFAKLVESEVFDVRAGFATKAGEFARSTLRSEEKKRVRGGKKQVLTKFSPGLTTLDDRS
jgi:hypothetical protein